MHSLSRIRPQSVPARSPDPASARRDRVIVKLPDSPMRLGSWRILVVLLALAALGIAMPAYAASRLCVDNDVIQFGNQLVGATPTANVAITN